MLGSELRPAESQTRQREATGLDPRSALGFETIYLDDFTP